MKGKEEVTQEEIYASSDAEDALKREEQEVLLLTLTPEVLNVDEETKMDCNRSMDGSSYGCGRGSRSRGGSTSMSTSGAQFDELKIMIQSLAVGVQNSTSAAVNATAEAVNSLGEEMKKEHAAIASVTALSRFFAECKSSGAN